MKVVYVFTAVCRSSGLRHIVGACGYATSQGWKCCLARVHAAAWVTRAIMPGVGFLLLTSFRVQLLQSPHAKFRKLALGSANQFLILMPQVSTGPRCPLARLGTGRVWVFRQGLWCGGFPHHSCRPTSSSFFYMP